MIYLWKSAEMIGASCGIVTQLFAKFKGKKLIAVHGSTLVIKNRADLKNQLESPPVARDDNQC